MKRLHLQLALDHGSLDDIQRMARLAAPMVDTIEVGTPLFMREGVAALRKVREVMTQPDCFLFADSKISDEGKAIAEICVVGGADALSVVDGASNHTLEAVRTVADKHGMQVWIDLLNHSNPVIRARALAPFIDGFVLHRPRSGLPTPLIEGLLSLDRPLRLAGGLTLERTKRVINIRRQTGREFGTPILEGIIVGRAITEAEDFEQAVSAFARLCHANMT